MMSVHQLPPKARPVPDPVPDPVQVRSALHGLLEMIAEEVAKKLLADGKIKSKRASTKKRK